jgi:transcription initiation factor TFIID subunit 8
MQQLFQRAHEYANLANRARSIASDVLMACEDLELPPKKMNEIRKSTARRKKGQHERVTSDIILNKLSCRP